MSDLFSSITPDPDTTNQVFLRVAVERGIELADSLGAGGLTYRGPAGTAVGERVEVPLGKGNRPAAGIVTEIGGPELAAGYPLSRIKPIARRTGGSLSPRLVELAHWMSTYYVCPIGMVLATMLPAAVKRQTGLRHRLELERGPIPAPEQLAELKLPPTAVGAWQAIAALPADRFPMPPAELARAAGAGNLGPINRLVKLGLLTEIRRPVVLAAPPAWESDRLDPLHERDSAPLPLTAHQAIAVQAVSEALGWFAVHLLRGVTGSGKTEVYLQIIERVLAAGRTALVMVPEISLTPQTAGRFIARFRRAGVAVLHSGLAGAQRHRQWALAASGAARVVVGARSSVFAPLDALGLIVVDEEHDPSYKQDQLPRYHARDLAIKRAQLEGCPVLLGSATPSLESWVNAMRPADDQRTDRAEPRSVARPKYRLLELPQRIGTASLPRVDIVSIPDENKARSKAGDRSPALHNQIGPTLEHAIADTLDAGGQVILLLNRRGYACHIACPRPECGWVMQCNDCDAGMVYHRGLASRSAPGFVRCHHCLAEQLLPRECPVCNARLNMLGAGTQRIEEELLRKFGTLLGAAPAGEEPQASPAPSNEPASRMLRLDSDTMHSARDYYQALDRFASGQVRLLLGTQMVAKGLDFPGVRLVGVIDADTSLAIPDFRAAERTFQLVSQVSGRAGRAGGGSPPGRVIVQTRSPHEPAIRLAAAHDFVAFAARELEARRRAGLPPITRLARIVVRDRDHAKAEQHAASLAESLRAAATPDVRIDGPGPCAIARIAAHHRIEITLLAPRRSSIQELLATLRSRGQLTSDTNTAVDIDPVALL